MRPRASDCVPFSVVLIPDWENQYQLLTPPRNNMAELPLHANLMDHNYF